MTLSPKQIQEFQETIWAYYREHGRHELPWREDPSPYKVLVSELMLQQTQVQRVVPKFDAFMYTCPDIAVLASKPLAEVLALWSGLGYNRRAKFLHRTAQIIVQDHDGILPDVVDELVTLPGVGKNTAGAIQAYVYQKPVVFIETNIRTVYFHHFYAHSTELVTDRELQQLVGDTLDLENSREWYWALMDYGTYLKKTAGGRIRTSKHYVKQVALKGSVREMRGRIVKMLIARCLPVETLYEQVGGDGRFHPALRSLERDGLLVIRQGIVCLTEAEETS